MNKIPVAKKNRNSHSRQRERHKVMGCRRALRDRMVERKDLRYTRRKKRKMKWKISNAKIRSQAGEVVNQIDIIQ